VVSIGACLGGLARLKRLDVQSNRLTFIDGLDAAASLEELYLARNGAKLMGSVLKDEKGGEAWCMYVCVCVRERETPFFCRVWPCAFARHRLPRRAYQFVRAAAGPLVAAHHRRLEQPPRVP